MMSRRINKSFYYLLPLIKGWSANADFPLNSYVKGDASGSIVLEYFLTDKHHNGEIVAENPEKKFVRCDIDPKFLNDYRLIVRGEYSKISDSSKNVIISRTPTLKDNQRVDGVLYKSKKIKRSLEESLGISDIDRYTNEYESLMQREETFNKEEHDRRDEEGVTV